MKQAALRMELPGGAPGSEFERPQIEDYPPPYSEGNFLDQSPERRDGLICEEGPPKAVATIKTRGATRAASADIIYTLEQPAEETDNAPVLIVPGYGGIMSAYRNFRHSLAEAGTPAISFRVSRSQGKGDASPLNYLLIGELASKATYAIMKDAHSRFGCMEFDLVGHSWGGHAATNVAMRRPELVRSVTYLASVGLEDHSLAQMLGRSLAFVQYELAPALEQLVGDSGAKIALESLHHILRNPARTAAEGIAAARCDIRPAVKRLGALGVKTAAVQFSHDHFFPPEETTLHTKRLLDAYEVMPGWANHLAPQLQPARVVEAHRRLLGQLFPNQSL